MKPVARVVPNQQGDFRHQFGGPRTQRGTIPRGSTQPLHLLYTFATKDPLVPVRVPRVRYLPLYYCFPYNAGEVGYRVVSDDEIEILLLSESQALPNFPYPNYPDEFPETPVSLVPISYEEHKTLVYAIAVDEDFLVNYHTSDSNLSDSDHDFLKQSGYPFTQLGGIHRLWQGFPDVRCPNKKCEKHKGVEVMAIFAVVWNQPVAGVFLWDLQYPDKSDIQIIFQICRKCQAIHAHNQCT